MNTYIGPVLDQTIPEIDAAEVRHFTRLAELWMVAGLLHRSDDSTPLEGQPMTSVLEANQSSSSTLGPDDTDVPTDASTSGPLAGPSQYVSQLMEVGSLRDGWDGFKARAVPLEALSRSLRILRFVDSMAAQNQALIAYPAIRATGNGSVQLEWEDPGASLFVEIPADEPASVFGHMVGREIALDEASPLDIWQSVKVLFS